MSEPASARVGGGDISGRRLSHCDEISTSKRIYIIIYISHISYTLSFSLSLILRRCPFGGLSSREVLPLGKSKSVQAKVVHPYLPKDIQYQNDFP